jgi:hypothetical protein
MEENPRVCNFCSQPVTGSVHITITLPPGQAPRFEYYHVRFLGDCWQQKQIKEAAERGGQDRPAAA